MKSYQGHVVDVVHREVFDGELVVDDGRIVQVKKCELPRNGKQWPYLMPGFIDSHVHIESSMMAPCEFARVAASHGTIGVVADPHEIGNVLGIEGVDYMIQSGKLSPFNYCFAAPSCVPACGGDIETSGAVIDAAGVEELMARDDIGVLGEMMNYPGVLNRYRPDARPVVGFVRGFGIEDGAIAGSVAHDCHNIVAVGSSDEHLLKAINRIIEMKGGLVAISGDDMADLALPIAGLMSPLGGYEVAYRGLQLREMARQAGCQMRAPFITMAFLCLPVIPELKINDKHLWDSHKMQVIN